MAVPPVTAVTTPVDEPILITVLLLLVHIPTPSLSDNVDPGHNTPVLPLMAATGAITFTVIVVMQPVPVEPMSGSILYVIVAEPTLTPVMSPPADVATAVFPLNHWSMLIDASLNIVVPPTHIVVKPVIGAGFAATTLTIVAIHPLGIVKVIVAVPAATPAVKAASEPVPDNTPSPLLLQVPPEEVSDRLIVRPAHSVYVP